MRRHSVEDPLAGLPGEVSGVSESSKLFRSIVKPALHPLEQIGGGIGWRASDGRGGRLAWGVGAGGCCGEGDAQALTSSAGSSQVSAQVLGFLAGIVGLLLRHGGAAVFFSSGGLDGHPRFALPVAALALKLGDDGLMLGAHIRQAQGLQASERRDCQSSGEQNASHHARSPH